MALCQHRAVFLHGTCSLSLPFSELEREGSATRRRSCFSAVCVDGDLLGERLLGGLFLTELIGMI